MNDSTHQQLVFEANRKSVGAAYFLWFFLGMFGAHRFYAGKTGSGIAQLALLLTVVGWLVLIPWLLADLFLIPGMIRDHNLEVIREISGEGEHEPAQRLDGPRTAADQRREEMLEDLRSTGYRKERPDMSHLYR